MNAHADSFLSQTNRSPAGLTAVVLLHGAAIGALIMFPPSFVRGVVPVFIVESIAADPPPPVEPTPPTPPQPARDAVTRVPVEVALIDPNRTPAIDPPPLPLLPPITPPAEPPMQAVTPPVLTEAAPDSRATFQPPYPPSMARQDITGRVTVRVLIGSDGRVKQVESVFATDPAFFEATRRQALGHWRFRPATRDGVAVESWRTMTVRFELDG